MNPDHNSYVAIVDDDERLPFLRPLPAHGGFQPVTFLSAEAFLEDTNRPRFDCLVLDYPACRRSRGSN